MARITYIEPSGMQHQIDVPTGESVMRGAMNNAIDGIVAECGGGLACATCHCYVDDAWIERVGPPSKIESEMLDCAASEVRRSSRLSCQITVSEALDGLIVHLPSSQI